LSKLRIIEVTDANEFAALGKSWQQLADQDEQTGLFNDWHWNKLWWAHYGHLGQLQVLVVYDDQQVVGIGPFYRCQSKVLGLRNCDTLRFIGTGGDTSPDDLNILALDSMRQLVTDSICDHLFMPEFPERLSLVDVRVESSFYTTFMARADRVRGYCVTPIVQSRRYASLPGQWSDFRKQISRNTHKQIKRRQNRLDALGNASLQICSNAEELEVAFKALVDLHSARWQSKGGSGSFDSESYQAFHFSLMQQLLQLGQLFLITLKIDEQIIAVEYAFLHKGTLLFFQTGFDPAYEHLSPGHVLMTYAIKHAIESGATRIDLLKGDYEYKSSYANARIESATLGFYRRGLNSVLARANDIRRRFKT